MPKRSARRNCAAAKRETKLRSRKEIFAILDQAIEDDLDPAKVHAM